MLHTISWAQFGAVLFVGLVIYYGYVLVRFYGRDLLGLVSGRKVGAEATGSGKEKEKEVAKDLGQSAGPGEKRQPRLFAENEEKVGETPELFKVAEKVIAQLRQVVSEAAATGVRREELEDRIRMVLSGYRQLIRTPYQVSVNNFIQRTCTTTFSLLLTDKEITELWEG